MGDKEGVKNPVSAREKTDRVEVLAVVDIKLNGGGSCSIQIAELNPAEATTAGVAFFGVLITSFPSGFRPNKTGF